MESLLQTILGSFSNTSSSNIEEMQKANRSKSEFDVF